MSSNRLLFLLLTCIASFILIVIIGQFQRLTALFQIPKIRKRAETVPAISERMPVELQKFMPYNHTRSGDVAAGNDVFTNIYSAQKENDNDGKHVYFVYPNNTEDFSLYGDESCPLNKDRNILAKLFEKWIDIAHRENIDYFLTCGSLLGSYRNGNLIPYDSDVDLLINRKDFEKIKKYHTKKRFKGTERDIFIYINRDFYSSYKERRRFSCTGKEVPAYMDHCSFQEPLGRIITENRHLDIYDYQKDGSKLWDPSEGGRTFNENEIFPLRKCFLMEYETRCPNKPKEVLRKFYGNNLSPLTVCKNGMWVKRTL